MDILINPVKAVLKAKKERSINKTLLILFESWIFVGIGLFITLYNYSPIIALGSSIATLLLGTLFSIFCSYIVDVIMSILGGKGKYFDGLTAVTYSSLPISVGVLVTSFLYLVSPILGGLVGFVAIAITTALSFSVYFRAVKELYSTDTVITLVGFLILMYVFIIALYLSASLPLMSAAFRSIPI